MTRPLAGDAPALKEWAELRLWAVTVRQGPCEESIRSLAVALVRLLDCQHNLAKTRHALAGQTMESCRRLAAMIRGGLNRA